MSEFRIRKEEDKEIIHLWFERGMFGGWAKRMINHVEKLLEGRWTAEEIKAYIHAQKLMKRAEGGVQSKVMADAIEWMIHHPNPEVHDPLSWFKWNIRAAKIQAEVNRITGVVAVPEEKLEIEKPEPPVLASEGIGKRLPKQPTRSDRPPKQDMFTIPDKDIRRGRPSDHRTNSKEPTVESSRNALAKAKEDAVSLMPQKQARAAFTRLPSFRRRESDAKVSTDNAAAPRRALESGVTCSSIEKPGNNRLMADNSISKDMPKEDRRKGIMKELFGSSPVVMNDQLPGEILQGSVNSRYGTFARQHQDRQKATVEQETMKASRSPSPRPMNTFIQAPASLPPRPPREQQNPWKTTEGFERAPPGSGAARGDCYTPKYSSMTWTAPDYYRRNNQPSSYVQQTEGRLHDYRQPLKFSNRQDVVDLTYDRRRPSEELRRAPSKADVRERSFYQDLDARNKAG